MNDAFATNLNCTVLHKAYHFELIERVLCRTSNKQATSSITMETRLTGGWERRGGEDK